MHKKIKIITIIAFITIFLIINVSKASTFYDIEYPPNSTGFADYTDEEAREDAEKQNLEAPDSSDLVGKSSNNYLKSLYIENATLEPEFNRQYVDYKVTLQDKNVKKINIIAEAEDENATINGIGEIELKDGSNQIPVEVRAENGRLQIYNLYIELPYEQSDLQLQDLQIYGTNIKTGKYKKQKLIPGFKSDVYEYNIDVSNDISYLDIRTKNPEDTFVSIKGGDTLELGQNKITVKVTDSKDETKSTTYIINANRTENEVNYKVYIIIASVIIIVLIFIIIHFNKSRRKGKRAK